jgi:hypothetical protein
LMETLRLKPSMLDYLNILSIEVLEKDQATRYGTKEKMGGNNHY